jgi:glycosyltransferase involved in cell wall biosynthesis
MRILQVCPGGYVAGSGGISEHVRRVSEGLVKRGHDVTVLATNPGGLASFEVVSGVKVRRLRRFAPGGAYFFSPSMFWALTRAEGFDVVHAHGFQAFPMHFASFAKCDRFVVTTHFHGAGHSAVRSFLFRLFMPFGKKTLEKADNIIADSWFEKSIICKQFRLQRERITVIPNGVDLSEFAGLRRHKREFKSILYVGRLESYKGVQYLVEVLSKLGDDVVLEIVPSMGAQAHSIKALENRGRQLEVHDRVLFFQNLPRPELLQKYFDADVFVLLSKYEAYSLVVAEALTAGTPCIVANTSALSEWVDNESCFGIGYPVRVAELARLINSVIHSEFNRKAAKKWMGTKILDWGDVARRLEDIYAGNNSG